MPALASTMLDLVSPMKSDETTSSWLTLQRSISSKARQLPYTQKPALCTFPAFDKRGVWLCLSGLTGLQSTSRRSILYARSWHALIPTFMERTAGPWQLQRAALTPGRP